MPRFASALQECRSSQKCDVVQLRTKLAKVAAEYRNKVNKAFTKFAGADGKATWPEFKKPAMYMCLNDAGV